MARIRTIKPDFWTDDNVAQLSPTAMLLFIGMWNFADDEGYLRDSVGQLRRQIFPDRGWDIDSSLAELLILGMVRRMDSEQGSLLHVVHMRDHQKIDHPTRTKFTQIRPQGAPIPEPSPSPRESSRGLGEGSRPKEGRKEGNGEEGKGKEAAPAAEPPLRCDAHLNSPRPPACGLCKDARVAHEAWQRHQGANVHQLVPKPVKHYPGLCDAHRQPEATCEMCEREARQALENQFGGTA